MDHLGSFESLEGHSGRPGGPFGLILGALGVIREALVDHLDAFWELWASCLESSKQLFKPWSENREYHENLDFPCVFQ